MKNFDFIFRNKKVCFDRLPAFGFRQDADGGNRYGAPVTGGQFVLTVTVWANGNISSELRDTDTGDLYTLHLNADATGAFVGQVRSECADILQKIADACCTDDVFKNRQTKMLLGYLQQKYRHEPEFLWEKFPNNAIVRRTDNKKWYAAVLTVAAGRPGLDNAAAAEILDLRGRPEDMEKLLDRQKFFPAYHMNKKHWYTVFLDDSLSDEELCRRTDESFLLAKK